MMVSKNYVKEPQRFAKGFVIAMSVMVALVALGIWAVATTTITETQTTLADREIFCGEGCNLKTLMASITDANTTNRYVITVSGKHQEYNITLKDGIDIIGYGAVFDLPAGANSPIFTTDGTKLQKVSLIGFEIDGNRHVQTEMANAIDIIGEGDSLTFQDLYISNVNGSAIYIFEAWRGQVTHCKFYSNTDYAMVIGQHMVIQNNEFSLNGGGIRNEPSDQLYHNKIMDNIFTYNHPGCAIYNLSASVVSGNGIYNNTCGIHTLGARSTITGNNIERHQGDGLFLTSSWNVVSGNNFIDNGVWQGKYAGVTTQTDATSNVIIGNVFEYHNENATHAINDTGYVTTIIGNSIAPELDISHARYPATLISEQYNNTGFSLVGRNPYFYIKEYSDYNNIRVKLASASSGGLIDMYDTSEVNQVRIRGYESGGDQGFFAAGHMGFELTDPDSSVHGHNGHFNAELTMGNSTYQANFSMRSNNGNEHCCGVDSAGTFQCKTGNCGVT